MEQFYSYQWEPWNHTPSHPPSFHSDASFSTNFDMGAYSNYFGAYGDYQDDTMPYFSNYQFPPSSLPNYMPNPNSFSHDYNVPNFHNDDLTELRDMANTLTCNTLAMQRDAELRELREMVKSLATNIMAFQQKTEASIQNLERQLGQIVSSVERLEAQMMESPKVTSELVDCDLELTSSFPLDFSSSLQEKEEDEETVSEFRRVMVDNPLFDDEEQEPNFVTKVEEKCLSKEDEKPNATIKENVFQAKDLLSFHNAHLSYFTNPSYNSPISSFPCFESCFVVCTPMPKQGRRMSSKEFAIVCGDFDCG